MAFPDQKRQNIYEKQMKTIFPTEFKNQRKMKTKKPKHKNICCDVMLESQTIVKAK